MKQTIDNVILQCDAENFSSCLGIADSCPGMKIKEPEFHVQWKPPAIGGSILPRTYEENKSYHSQPSPRHPCQLFLIFVGGILDKRDVG